MGGRHGDALRCKGCCLAPPHVHRAWPNFPTTGSRCGCGVGWRPLQDCLPPPWPRLVLGLRQVKRHCSNPSKSSLGAQDSHMADGPHHKWWMASPKVGAKRRCWEGRPFAPLCANLRRKPHSAAKALGRLQNCPCANAPIHQKLLAKLFPTPVPMHPGHVFRI